MLYQTVKQYCDKRGYSIAELEQKAGIPNGTIGKWREFPSNQEDANPRINTLKAIAKVLRVSVNTLIKG